MPDPDFGSLRDHLLRSGVAPRHVLRTISELTDHYEDLEREAIERGLPPPEARQLANERIGATRTIAQHVLHRPELKSWVYRYPQLARVALPLAYVMLLPVIPLYAGIANAPAIARWFSCLLLSALVTAAMLLAMQISIAIS
jgi:hypothetical protein